MGLSASAPWRKYYGATPASLEYPHKTMYEMIASAAKRKPDHVAYIFMGKKTTYSEFMKRIDAAAKGLYKMGIRKGDKVTICMANTPQAGTMFASSPPYYKESFYCKCNAVPLRIMVFPCQC